jgi:hypothetical protein
MKHSNTMNKGLDMLISIGYSALHANIFFEKTCRVDWPIINPMPMQEHFGKSSQFFSIWSDLKCYRSAFSSSTSDL